MNTQPTPEQMRNDYNRGWDSSRYGHDYEPTHSLDSFDAGYADEQAGARKYAGLRKLIPDRM